MCQDLSARSDPAKFDVAGFVLKLQSWDYAFSCEIIARAHAAKKNQKEFAKFHKMALDAICVLSDKEDRDICQTELDRGPWFGGT